ncbi:MAG: tetraacyldisaccharide 4'-kinase [Planctomycetota bacterium]|nr:tetraacyldisaccharide 4'-kinase [Planctomycetota bacterium]
MGQASKVTQVSDGATHGRDALGTWHGSAPPGPLQGVILGPIARLLAKAYGSVIRKKNAAFDAGRGVVEFDRPVISVGNLSVGGTGKTPMVLHLVEMLRRADRTPVVAMRGYASSGGPTGQRSDEASAYRRAFPELPIVARPDRSQGLIELFGTSDGEAIDCIVLDDGFQHRQIARQLDLVLIDASRPPFGDQLLPAGWLREPAESLKRAHAVIVTHVELASPAMLHRIDAAVTEITGQRPLVLCRHDWSELAVFDNGPRPSLEVGSLAGRRVVAACAIGNPHAFVAACDRAVGEHGHVHAFIRPDHDAFAPATVRKLIAAARETQAEYIVVTEKDWSKLMHAPADDWPCPILRPRLQLTFERGEPELRSLVLETLARTYAKFAT